MANYLYRTMLWTDTANVVGLNESQNTADLADYTANHQSGTIKISDIQIAETTFLSDEAYTDFDSLITGDFDWGDVREVTRDNHYELYLISSEPL